MISANISHAIAAEEMEMVSKDRGEKKIMAAMASGPATCERGCLLADTRC